jgi:hypothetical protein
MTETRRDRAARVLERLEPAFEGGDLPDLAVERILVYAELPGEVDADDVHASLDAERVIDSGTFPGTVYDVPTFGVTVLVFESGFVACLDAPDRDVSGAAISATVAELAGTPVESAPDTDLRTVPLTAGPDGTWDPTVLGGDDRDTGDDEHTGEAVDGDTADGRPDDVAASVGVTPAPCADCGRVPDGWERHCPRCGNDLKPGECAACGEPLARWMLYCPACGTDANEPF